MFRRTGKLWRANRERILSLVLLPALFLGTLPHTACICADGHREQFCQAKTSRARASEVKSTACCGCSCCQARSSEGKHDCCRSKGCDPAGTDKAPAHGLNAKTGPCCHPFVALPAPAVKASKVEQPAGTGLVDFVESPRLNLEFASVHPSIDRSHSSTPPPLDAVIVFQRLTI